jgi:hypothetical protein
MPNTTELGQAALPTWRGAVAAFYVVTTVVRMIRTARG